MSLACFQILFLIMFSFDLWRHPIVDEPINLFTLRNDTISLNDYECVILVLAGSYSCSDCYPVIEKAVRRIDSTVPLFCVINTGSCSVSTKRDALNRMRKLINTDQYFFDSCSSVSPQLGKYRGGIFGRFDVAMCPCVMIVRRNKPLVFIPYSKIFPISGFEAIHSKESESYIVNLLLGYLRNPD